MGDVLVVDDEVEIVQLIVEILSDEGYTLRSTHDGASAIAAIHARPPALVLLDLSMPTMTGSEVLLHLRSNGFPDLPVVIMSASRRVEGLDVLGATEFLAKPFDLNALLSCVNRYVGQRSAA